MKTVSEEGVCVQRTGLRALHLRGVWWMNVRL